MTRWAPPRPRALAAAAVQWIRSDGQRALRIGAISFGITWFINFAVMTTRGASFGDLIASTTTGNQEVGIVYWAVLSVTVGAVVAYGFEVGWAGLWGSFKAIPQTIARLFRQEGSLAWSLLLWGASLTLAISGLMAPTVSAAFGIGLIGLAPTAATGLLGRMVARAWVAVTGLFLPQSKPTAPGLGGQLIALIGSVLGFLVASRASELAVRLVAAAVLAVAASLLLAGRPSRTATVVGLVAMAGAWWMALDGVAAALGGCCGEGHHHGVKEAGEAARLSLIGGAVGAAAGVAGAGLGAALAASPPPDPSGWDWGADVPDPPDSGSDGPEVASKGSDKADEAAPPTDPATAPQDPDTSPTPPPPPPPPGLDDIPETGGGIPPPPSPA